MVEFLIEEKVKKTLNYYDGISKGYSELYHNEQQKKIVKILKYLPHKGKILDLGSGDGVFNQYVSKEIILVSVDLSYKLLKLNPSIFKVNASILHLPIKNNSFDFIVSFTVFQDLPNLELAINEVYRILKPKSLFIITFLNMSTKSENLFNLLEKKFIIIEKIEDLKDIILVLKKI